ncbi:MAG: glycosyltransferase family 2 protein [Nitrospinales bacterium]
MVFSLVIPFYNEEECASQIIDSLVQFLDSSAIDYELILVDNGSRDRTAALIDQKVARHPRLKKVTVKVNEGYGWGIICGLQEAQGDYVGFMCGDGQIHPQDVVKSMSYASESNCAMVKACRNTRQDGLLRRIVTRIYNSIFALIFNLKTHDLNGTPKFFKRSYLDILDIQSKDWFIDAEIIIKLESLGVKIDEIPVAFHARKGGSSHVKIVTTCVQFLKNAYRMKTGKDFLEWKKSKR